MTEEESMNIDRSKTEEGAKTDEKFVLSLASRLKKVRLEQGLSQEVTAKETGFSQGWISAIERDKLAGVDYIKWLVEKSKLPTDYFIYGESDEVTLLQVFRELTSEQRTRVLDSALCMVSDNRLLDDFKAEIKAIKYVSPITGVKVDVGPSDVGKSALKEKCLKYIRREGSNALAKKMESQLTDKTTWSEYLKVLTKYVEIELTF